MEDKALSHACKVILAPFPEGGELWIRAGCSTCSSHLLTSSKECKKRSAAKTSFKCWLQCLGLCVAFSAAGGITCAVEGARTRSLGHGGLLGSWRTAAIARGRKSQACRGSGEQMEHVSQSLKDIILKYNQLK